MKPTLMRITIAAYLCFAGSIYAQRYTITLLPPLNEDSFSLAYAINDRGQVAGRSNGRAVIWIEGVPLKIQTVEARSSVAFGLNDRGQATGNISLGGTLSGAFFWNGVSMHRIMHPSGFISEAYALNNAGLVVGTGLSTGGFLWNGAAFYELVPLPGDHSATPYAISNQNVIVGGSRGELGTHPVIWSTPHSPTRISVPSGTQGRAWGLNDHGVVVGEYHSNGTKPFYWSAIHGPRVLPLPAGATSGYAWAINSDGIIIGRTDLGAAVWHKTIDAEYVAFHLESLLPLDSGWTDLNAGGINSAGQIVGSGVWGGERFAVILHPTTDLELALRTDADRSGTTEFDNESDKTTSLRPFYFWLNNDRDALGVEASRGPIDSSDDRIMTPMVIDEIAIPQNGAIRDFEDLSRMALRLSPALKSAVEHGASLAIQAIGSGAINLFYTRTAGNETRYLTDEIFAINLVNDPATNIAIKSTPVESGAVRWNALEKLITNDDWENGRVGFLWEAVKAGQCILVAQVHLPDGSVIESEPVHLSLHPVQSFFQRARATPANGFPPPWETNGLPPQMGWEVVHSQSIFSSDLQNVDLVWVHGWRLPEWERQNWGEMMFKRLWHAGFRGRLRSFTWPTHSGDDSFTEVGPEGKLSFDRSEYRAWNSGISLQQFLHSIRASNPNAVLAVVAHSMGNVVVGEALRRGAPSNLHIMMQAAVPASSYDPHPGLQEIELMAQDLKSPTPDLAGDLGYRGHFSHISVPTINFHNAHDFALQTGKLLGIRASWVGNQLTKPGDPIGRGEYRYDNFIPGFYSGKRLLRRITDLPESHAFLARSRTRAAGAQPLTGFDLSGTSRATPITGRIDLSQPPYRFSDDSTEHSAQFNRPIQRRVIDFFAEIRRLIQP